MRYTLSAKNFTIYDTLEKDVEKHVDKLATLLKDLDHGDITLDIVIREEKVARHIKNTHDKDLLETNPPDTHPKADSPIHYTGTLHLTLPKKPLIAHMDESKPQTALNEGFTRLIREIKTYKETHLKGNSHYPDHTTIRKEDY